MYCLHSSTSGSGGVSGGTGGSVTATENANGAGVVSSNNANSGGTGSGIPIIMLTTDMTKTIEVALSDDVYGDTPASIPTDDTRTITFIAKDLPTADTPYISVACTLIDASKAIIQIPFTADHTKSPGLYFAGIQVRVNSKLVSEYKCLLQINLGMSHALNGGVTCLNPAEVRMALMDYSKDANTLLNDFEFSDLQILHAITRPVNEWNAMPPHVDPVYTPSTFPAEYHEPWLKATCSYLLEAASYRYNRNTIPHNAAGLSMDPNNKGAMYFQQAMALRQEWKAWLCAAKTAANMNDVWGSTANPLFDGYTEKDIGWFHF